MNQIANWFAVNDLIITTEKTKELFFQGRSLSTIYKPDLYLNTKAITYTSNLKFLGMYITETLSWASHIQYLTQKQNEALYLIKYLHDCVNLPILRNVYFTKF
jgi:hypothetical protein